jgi:hypothetical protein
MFARFMTVACQFAAALLVGVFYYMLAMAMTVHDGILSLIFQPFTAVILATLAIGFRKSGRARNPLHRPGPLPCRHRHTQSGLQPDGA